VPESRQPLVNDRLKDRSAPPLWTVASSEDQSIGEIIEFLRRNSHFAGLGIGRHVDIVALADKSRPKCRIVHLKVVGVDKSRTVLVKISRRSEKTTDRGTSRPRIVEPVRGALRFQQEASALTYLSAHLGRSHDLRIGAVRLLGEVEEWDALIMEKFIGRPLRSLALSPMAHLRRANRHRVLTAFHNAGVWLRYLHDCPPPEHARVRHSTRSEWELATAAIVEYLQKTAGFIYLPLSMAQAIEAGIRRSLPAVLPLAPAHGDFGLRNILVAPENRVAGIDTLLRWIGPSFEDLGYFLTDLWMGRPQRELRRVGFAETWVNRAGHALLDGYFCGRPLPRAVWAFQLITTIDRWAAMTERHAASRHSATHQHRAYAREVERLNSILCSS
jgi:aminoglycoside phosphotransferase